jgi:hypothetical protein
VGVSAWAIAGASVATRSANGMKITRFVFIAAG